MELVYNLVVVLHVIGLAAIIGGWLAVVRAPRVLVPMVHGALLQVVTGLALVGLSEAVLDKDVDHTKIGIKLVIALVVAALAFLHRKKRNVAPGVVHAIGGLAVLNVLIAVLW